MKSERATRRSTRLLVGGAVFSAIVTGALLLCRPLVALGYLGGVLTGAGMLSALVFVLHRAVAPPQERTGPIWPLAVLQAVKLGLAGAVAFVVILVWGGSAAGFAIGYLTALVTLIVIVGLRPPSTTPQIGRDE